MKKLLLILLIMYGSLGSVWSQCVPTCSNYAVSAITFTTFPSAGTNAIPMFSPNTDDGLTPPVPIGFNFNFYCTTYSTVLIYTNGLLQFDIGAPSTFPLGYDPAQLLPSPTVPNGMVAFKMDDLDPTVGGTVTYTTIGVPPNQMFILTYSNVPIFGQSSLLNSGQIVLHETTNMIDIYSISAPVSPNLATQGIENASGSAGIAVPSRNQSNWSATNSAYRFSPYTPAPPTAITGNTLLCQGQSDFYQATFMTGASAYGWTLPNGWVGTSTLSSITATSGVSGNLSVTATYTCGTSLPTVFSVNVVPAPVVSILSATPSILCSGKTVTFNTSGALTYTLDPGGINGVPPFTDVATTSTSYTLSGTDVNGCVSINAPTTFITVKETPTVTVNSGTMCSGGTFTMTPAGAPNYVFSSVFPTVSPTLAGQYNYSVTGTATNGCVSDPVVSSLTVYALPNVGAAASRTAICIKESVPLTATGAASYLWSNLLTTAVITVTPNTTTIYTVTGTDALGCVATSTVAVKVNPCTGIGETQLNASHVSIYPNPGKGVFQMRLNGLDLAGSAMDVYDAFGRLILTKKELTENSILNLETFANGFYYVKVFTSYGEEVTKIMKE